MKKTSLILLMLCTQLVQISYAQHPLIRFISKIGPSKVEKVGIGLDRAMDGYRAGSKSIPGISRGIPSSTDNYKIPSYTPGSNRFVVEPPPSKINETILPDKFNFQNRINALMPDEFSPSNTPKITDPVKKVSNSDKLLNKERSINTEPVGSSRQRSMKAIMDFDEKRWMAFINEFVFKRDLKNYTTLQQNTLHTLGYYEGKIGSNRDDALQQALEKFNLEHPYPLKTDFKLGDEEAFSPESIQKNLDEYAALLSNLGYEQLKPEIQMPQLQDAIGRFQKTQALPESKRFDAETKAKIAAIFTERARKLKALGKLPADAEPDAATITEALLAYGKEQQEETILEAEAVLEEDWKEKMGEILELGFSLPIDDLMDLIDLMGKVLDYLKEDKNKVQYPRIESYLKEERAFVDYILGARDLPCELNLIAQNQYTFRYLGWGTRRLVLRKLTNDWELLELDAERKNVRKRVRGTEAVHEFEIACGLLLAKRSTDSLGYIYISPYPTPAQQLRIQLGKETLTFDLKEGKLVGTAVDTVLKAYFLRTRHSVLVQNEALSESSNGEDKIDPKVLAQIQQSLNTWAAEAQQSIHFITCLNERYSNMEDLAKVKTRKDIAVHTGKNLGEKDLKSLQKLLKKLEKAAKKSNETAEPNEASVVVWVGNESSEEWALYLDSLALQGALVGKHLVLFAGQVPGTRLLQAVTQGKTGLSTVTVFPELVSGPVTVSWLKALYSIMETAPAGEEVPLEKLLWQSLELAMVKVPVEKRGSWAELKYFQVHRLESER